MWSCQKRMPYRELEVRAGCVWQVQSGHGSPILSVSLLNTTTKTLFCAKSLNIYTIPNASLKTISSSKPPSLEKKSMDRREPGWWEKLGGSGVQWQPGTARSSCRCWVINSERTPWFFFHSPRQQLFVFCCPNCSFCGGLKSAVSCRGG